MKNVTEYNIIQTMGKHVPTGVKGETIVIANNIACDDCGIMDDFMPLFFTNDATWQCTPCWKLAGNTMSTNMSNKLNDTIKNVKYNNMIRKM